MYSKVFQFSEILFSEKVFFQVLLEKKCSKIYLIFSKCKYDVFLYEKQSYGETEERQDGERDFPSGDSLPICP